VSLWKDAGGGTKHYVVWNSNVGNNDARYIPPGQGMMVQAKSTGNGTVLNFSNTIRTHTNASGFEKKNNQDSVSIPNVLQITARSNGTFDDTYIRFKEDAGETFNGNYEVAKLFSSDAEIPQIFTLGTENKLAINAIPQPEEESIIPLGIKMEVNSQIILEFTGIETFPTEQVFLLQDKQSDTIYNIRESSSIAYDYSTSDPENRFNLIFSFNTNIEESPNTHSVVNPIVYNHQNKLYIIDKDHSFKEAKISLFNVLGQRVWAGQMNKDFNNGMEFSLPKGYYLVHIQTKEITFTEKVYFY
jgi:hypothetical protein